MLTQFQRTASRRRPELPARPVLHPAEQVQVRGLPDPQAPGVPRVLAVRRDAPSLSALLRQGPVREGRAGQQGDHHRDLLHQEGEPAKKGEQGREGRRRGRAAGLHPGCWDAGVLFFFVFLWLNFHDFWLFLNCNISIY